MFSHKEDKPFHRDLKKGIVSQFQTSIKGGKRIDEDYTGIHKTHYSQKKLEDGSMEIKGEFEENDCLDANSKKNAKHTFQHSENVLKITNKGTIKEIDSDSDFEFELKEERPNVDYADKNKDPHKEGEELNEKFSANGHLTLKLIGTRKPQSSHKELHEILKVTKQIVGRREDSNVDAETHDHVYIIRHLEVLETAELSQKSLIQHGTSELEDFSEEALNADIKKRIEEHHNGFENLLNELILDSKHFSLAVQYLEAFPEEGLPHVQKMFDEENLFSIQQEMQSLMTSSQSEIGFQMLKKTVQRKPLNPRLMNSGIFYLSNINKPSKEVFSFLKKYISFKEDSISQNDLSQIHSNAFLVAGNLASKMDEKTRNDFALLIRKRIQKAKSEVEIEDALAALHNLGYRGNKESADIVRDIVNSDGYSEKTKIEAVKSLSSHINEYDGEHHELLHADDVIHNIVISDDHSDEVKVAAIRTQSERQKVNQNDASVLLLSAIRNHPSTSYDVSNEINDYLSRTSYVDDYEDSEEQYGNTLVANKIKNALEKVKWEIIGRDHRNFDKKCFKIAKKGTQVCVDDPFLKQLIGGVSNDLAKNMERAGSFVWEKKWGNEAANLYVSFLALGASRTPGCDGVSEKKQMLWASMVAFNVEAKILRFFITVFRAELKFNRVADGSDVDAGVAVTLAHKLKVRLSTKELPLLGSADFNLNDALNCDAQHLDYDKLTKSIPIFEKVIAVKVIVIFQIKVSVSVDMGVGVTLDMCMKKYKMMAGPSPYAKLSISIMGTVSILIASASVEVNPSSEVRVPMLAGVDSCQFGAEVNLDISPFNFDVYVHVRALFWKFKWNVYSVSGKTYSRTLVDIKTPNFSNLTPAERYPKRYKQILYFKCFIHNKLLGKSVQPCSKYQK